MAVTIHVQTAFDATLPFDKPDTVAASPKMRFVAGDLSSGAVSSWTSDLGTAHVLAQATATAQPSRNIVGTAPAVVFDGTTDTLTSVYTPSTVMSVYVVFKATNAAKGSAQAIVAFGGAYIGLGSTGKLIAIGTSGSVQSVGTLTSGVLYAACITLNGNAGTVEVAAENVAGTTTVGTLDKLHLGASAGAAFFGGEIRELRIFDTLHSQAQRTAELAGLRSWWGAT